VPSIEGKLEIELGRRAGDKAANVSPGGDSVIVGCGRAWNRGEASKLCLARRVASRRTAAAVRTSEMMSPTGFPSDVIHSEIHNASRLIFFFFSFKAETESTMICVGFPFPFQERSKPNRI
jgi:hypothetical protein